MTKSLRNAKNKLKQQSKQNFMEKFHKMQGCTCSAELLTWSWDIWLSQSKCSVNVLLFQRSCVKLSASWPLCSRNKVTLNKRSKCMSTTWVEIQPMTRHSISDSSWPLSRAMIKQSFSSQRASSSPRKTCSQLMPADLQSTTCIDQQSTRLLACPNTARETSIPSLSQTPPSSRDITHTPFHLKSWGRRLRPIESENS